ncbi:MAG: DUF4440 domain-containing protein [Bacteroidales bacterium]
MNIKNNLLCMALLISIFISGANSLNAQENWSPTQKEVWKNVNDYFSAFSKGDIQGYLSYIHEDFEGWEYNAPFPRRKADVEKMLTNFFKTNKVVTLNLTPVTVKVMGETAFVHYSMAATLDNGDQKKSEITARYTDILVKQGNKWVIIGDHGGMEKK